MAPLFLTSTSERSRRTAVIAEEIDSIWLYLSPPGEERPQIACWVLNSPAAPDEPDPAFYRQRSAPPPLPARHISTPAPDPWNGRWSFLWAADGNGVAALLEGDPIAFAIAGRLRGYARYVRDGASAWAIPWDDAIFAAAFEIG